MTNEIRIISIDLENYRQYYGRHKINLASRNEGFTIIVGKNGEGKSNLLNAISWCFYHEEPHGMKEVSGRVNENRSLPIINNKYIKELPEGTMGKTSVRIQLMVGDDTYSISRIMEIEKHRLEFQELLGGRKTMKITKYASDQVPVGCEIRNEGKDFVIKKKAKDESDFHDTIKEGAPETIMDKILPRGLSKYFLLDGEFLEGFWKNTDIIKDGIEQISQLSLLDSLKESIDKILITTASGVDVNTDKLGTQIQQLVWFEKSFGNDGNEKFSEEMRWKENPDEEDAYYHATGKPRIKDLKSDISRMEDRMRAIITRLPNISTSNLKELSDQYVALQSDFEYAKETFETNEKNYLYNLITKGPKVFLKDAITTSVQIIEKRMDLGDLPVKQRRQFADDLLKRGTCICGEDLASHMVSQKETNARRTKIESFKNNLTGKGDLDAAVEMRFNFTNEIINDYESFLKSNFGDIRKHYAESKERLETINKTMKGIEIKLKSTNNNETKDLISEHTRLQEKIRSKNDEITEITRKLTANSKTLSNLKIQLEKGLKKNERARKTSHSLDVWNRIYGHLERAYGELSEDIRKSVQDNTWKNFQSLLANPKEFKDFVIEPDYTIHLVDIYDTNKIRNLSAGQSLILTLAFVAALREPTGYKFPLVVDSPLGKIDGGNRYNISQHLPNYMPEEQLTLLVTDTEYAANLPPDPDYPDLPNTSFGNLLSEKIPLKHIKIKKEIVDENNIGNSTIKEARLVPRSDGRGWVVEIV